MPQDHGLTTKRKKETNKLVGGPKRSVFQRYLLTFKGSFGEAASTVSTDEFQHVT